MIPVPCIPEPQQAGAIPTDLIESPHWVVWRWEQRSGKWTKPPYTAQGRPASSTDPSTWCTFSEAMEAAVRLHAAGVGYVLSADDDLIGIDLDHCIDGDGVIAGWASETVAALDSYAELSPSGTGLRVFVRGTLPPEGRKRGNIEIYDRERYLTVTGRRLPSAAATINRRQGAIDALHARTFPATPRAPTVAPNVTALSRSDADILSLAHNARNGSRFAALWLGDTSAYLSASEADAALVAMLGFWCQGDAGQVDRLFRGSGLMRPKWDERHGAASYGVNTIAGTLAVVHERYTPGRTALTPQPAPNGAEPAMLETEAGDEPTDYPLTDAGNGELLANLYGDILRYDHLRGRWLLWQGHHWAADQDGAVQRLGKDGARERLRRAADIPDTHAMRRAIAWAVQSENKGRIDAALYMAGREPPLADAGTEWDRDPWLLGVWNGIVDLRSGALRDGRREDRIMTRALVSFDPLADCPRWRRFLMEVFSDEADTVEFVQRAIGYSLTGITSEQVLFLMIGKGTNGKSTLQAILRGLLGAYAANTPFATFESSSRGSIPNDLAALAGKRVVTCSESAEQARLNEGRLKAFVHGDDTSARFLNHEFFTYRPAAKLWLASNHRPRVTDDSLGFWRSVLLIPFRRAFDDASKDKGLEATLLGELPGILTWAVEGCIKWQADGLRPPAAVTLATQEYRQDSDPLGEFLAACCEIDPRHSEMLASLWGRYQQWAADQGLPDREKLGHKGFSQRLADRFTRRPTKAGKAVDGLRLAKGDTSEALW